MGASFPWTIRRVREIAPSYVEVSCTLGDLPNLPGSVALAALGAATTGIDYVKVGLGRVATKKDALFLLKNAVKAAQEYNPSIKVVATGYADAERAGSISPLLIPEVAVEAGANVAMIDTAVKDGSNLFMFLSNAKIMQIVEDAHAKGLKAALAGSLRKEQISSVYALRADIIGLRGAACTNGDRINGRVTQEKVDELKSIVRRLHA